MTPSPTTTAPTPRTHIPGTAARTIRTHTHASAARTLATTSPGVPSARTTTLTRPAPATGPGPVPGAGHTEAHLWAHAPLPRPSAWYGLLDSTELQRCNSFAHELDLARFVTGRMLAKTALAHLAGTTPENIHLHARCPQCGGPHGKPRVTGPAAGWELSISHSGDIVAVAIAWNTPLGLDVERGEPWNGTGLPPEYELVLTPHERDHIEQLPAHHRARAALTYWTRKEAVLKATGEGLNTPMTDFTLSGPDEPPALLQWHPPHPTRPTPAITDIHLGHDYHGAIAALNTHTLTTTHHDNTHLHPTHRTTTPHHPHPGPNPHTTTGHHTTP